MKHHASLPPAETPARGRLGVLCCLAVASPQALAAVTDIDYLDAGIRPLSSEHTFYESVDGDVRLKAGLSLYAAGIVTDDVNFGSDRSIDGAAPTQKSPAWWEAAAKPGVLGEWDIPDSGTLFSGVQGSYALTRGSRYGDAAGTTPNHPEQGRIDRAYLGWQSGTLWADALGEDAVTLSFGRQKFIFGDGFLVGDGYTDLGKYAGYYVGPSEAFARSAVATIDSHGWHGDLFYLKADQYVSGGPDNETSLNGTNVDYTWGERAKFGAAYLDVYDSDIPIRDGMEVYNLRAKGIPLANVPNLSLGGQWVHQKNDDENTDEDGWYLQATYTFKNAPLRPQFMYRRAEFSENYDTLFYDFAGGWGNWFMGEIVGEYMLFNSNLDIDMVKASIQPRDDLETGLIGYRFRYHDVEAAGASDSDFAKEVNLYADWSITDKFSVSAVYAVAFPDEGADERFAGNDETSQLFEIYTYYRF
ncbi:hypothetical protein SAMN02745148_02471 [Modicisalibacter ilicicola DSM 19980]|uniref:Alginate export n=1 Tax=Modicisalibacter ilicicola DSM 19980 TaxID=1121942 RepID=A0A1M5B4M8_9GAMM|nr:hypothetical protein [Halomonas ilicicola]SHF37464.1 hypothetical protein SAMN02745148_02471 [Halomonas ilicicola DSM 19980]